MRPLIAILGVLASGSAVGFLVRLAISAPAPRAGVAAVTMFGLATCLGAAFDGPDVALRRRAIRGAMIAASAAAGAWLAATIAGDASLVGSAVLVGGAATAACGAATLLRTRGVGCARSQFAAAALPISCAALVLVADPLVEWDGASTERAPARAAFVLASSPAVAIAADSGIDWQRSRWMYDGPGAGGSGLSVIGAYYPSRPASALAWGLAAAGVGFVALLVARPRVRIPG